MADLSITIRKACKKQYEDLEWFLFSMTKEDSLRVF